MGWDWTASTMSWYWMGLDGSGDDVMMRCVSLRCHGNGWIIWMGWGRMGLRWRWRCVVMRYDALSWDWVGWDGDGDGDGGGGGDGNGGGDTMHFHGIG